MLQEPAPQTSTRPTQPRDGTPFHGRRLLVTGGGGYIGSVVACQLLEAGAEVVVLDNFSTGHRHAVPAGATIVEADLRERGSARAALEGVDTVLHFAAKSIVAESVREPSRYWENNVLGTRNLLDSMTEAGTMRIVFSSTAAVYGNPEHDVLDETSRTCPVNTYGATKLAAELMVENHYHAHGGRAVVLRYFNVAGAYQGYGEEHLEETHLIPRVLGDTGVAIYGSDWPTHDGTCVRDYVHVADLAAAHLRAADVDLPGVTTVNLGSGRGYSVLEVLETAERVTGRRIERTFAPRRAGDPARLVTSNQRACELLDWRPRLGLDSMIRDAWEFHRPTN